MDDVEALRVAPQGFLVFVSQGMVTQGTSIVVLGVIGPGHADTPEKGVKMPVTPCRNFTYTIRWPMK